MYDGRGGGSCMSSLAWHSTVYNVHQQSLKLVKSSPWLLWPFPWLERHYDWWTPRKLTQVTMLYHFLPKCNCWSILVQPGGGGMITWVHHETQSSWTTLTVTHWIQECKLQTGSLLAWVSLWGVKIKIYCMGHGLSKFLFAGCNKEGVQHVHWKNGFSRCRILLWHMRQGQAPQTICIGVLCTWLVLHWSPLNSSLN